MACPVLDETTGEYLNYHQLMKHPTLSKVGVGPEGQGQRIKGTDTFFVTRYEDIPQERRKEITYTSIVCEVRPQKADFAYYRGVCDFFTSFWRNIFKARDKECVCTFDELALSF